MKSTAITAAKAINTTKFSVMKPANMAPKIAPMLSTSAAATIRIAVRMPQQPEQPYSLFPKLIFRSHFSFLFPRGTLHTMKNGDGRLLGEGFYCEVGHENVELGNSFKGCVH